MTELPTLFQLGPYRVAGGAGQGRGVVISFSSIGHDAGRAPSFEFIASAMGKGRKAAPRSAYFVSDESRSWANAPQFEQMLQGLAAQLPPDQPVVAIGVSMGAFSALAASRLMALDAVIAIAPQWSVAPSLMPQEGRWREWTANIEEFRWPTCPLPPEGCQGYLLHAGLDDGAHSARFGLQRNVDHLDYAGVAHSELASSLKARGIFAGLLDAAVAGDRRRVLRQLCAAGGVRRKA